LSLQICFQTLEGNHHDCNVVQSFLVEGQFHDIFNSLPTELVYVAKTALISLESVPNYLNNFKVVEFVVNAIAYMLFEIHPKIIKSSSSVMFTLTTSGSQTIARELPPNYANFASISPKVRVTESRPGKALCGPKIKLCSYPS